MIAINLLRNRTVSKNLITFEMYTQYLVQFEHETSLSTDNYYLVSSLNIPDIGDHIA